MDRLARILLFAALLLAGCQPALTPSPIAAPTSTPLPPTLTPAPTATATLTPAPTPTATENPLPAFDAWSEGQLATLNNYQVMEINGIQTVVSTLADGREIQVLEYVNNEWRPTYNTMDLFAHGDSTFDLELAQQTQFFRVEEKEIDGEMARWLDEADYARYLEKMTEIYASLDKTGLAPSLLGVVGRNMPLSPTTGVLPMLSLTRRDGNWQIIGAGSGQDSDGDRVFVVTPAMSNEFVPMVYIKGLNYIDPDPDFDTIPFEDDIQSLSRGEPFTYMSICTSTTDIPNPDFIGSVDLQRFDYFLSWVRGKYDDRSEAFDQGEINRIAFSGGPGALNQNQLYLVVYNSHIYRGQ